MKNLTAAGLARLMVRLRAKNAREYSSREEFRRMYRDGFTDGWEEALATVRGDAINAALEEDAEVLRHGVGFGVHPR
jgi:hypothetical protein